MTAALAALGFYLHFVPYFFAGPPPAAACAQGPGFRYCVFEPPYGVREDPDALLYFLHYGSGDEESWRRNPVSRVFYAEFRRRGLKAPRVVAVSYGLYWRFVDKEGGRLPSPLASEFLDRAMPWLESRGPAPKRRYLWGISQGGLNAASLLFRRSRLWAGAVLSCSALYTINVFASPREIEEYAGKYRLDQGRLKWGLDLILERVAGPDAWKKENPLVRAAVQKPLALPPLFIDCNRSDEFGFGEGARAFAGELRRRGQNVAFQENPGGHCEIDARAASAFLADLQEKG